MTFSLHQGWVAMSSQITHTIINIHPLAHILDICAIIFSSCTLLTFIPMSSYNSAGDNHQSMGGRSGKNTHISRISNSVTNLRSYTNTGIAVITGNYVRVANIASLSADIERESRYHLVKHRCCHIRCRYDS